MNIIRPGCSMFNQVKLNKVNSRPCVQLAAVVGAWAHKRCQEQGQLVVQGPHHNAQIGSTIASLNNSNKQPAQWQEQGQLVTTATSSLLNGPPCSPPLWKHCAWVCPSCFAAACFAALTWKTKHKQKTCNRTQKIRRYS